MYYKRKYVLGFIFILGSLISYSQTEQTLDTVYKELPVFTATDSTQVFMRYIERNVRYPETAHPHNSSIIVFIGFTIDTAGYVSDVKVLKGSRCRTNPFVWLN